MKHHRAASFLRDYQTRTCLRLASQANTRTARPGGGRWIAWLALILGLAMLEVQGAEPQPFAKAQPLRLDAARWTDGFWAERFAVCRTQTVPAMWRVMSGTEYSQYLENFRVAAGLKEGSYRGACHAPT